MTRALRIGVLLGGNLVEEKLFTISKRATTPITFGQSLRCSLSVPGDGVPHEHVLFVFDQGRPILRATAAMSGRIAHGDSKTELRAGDIAVPIGARGKIVIGDATLLFQELAAAPASPRPVLPASVRGTLADRIDRRLAAIIGASILVHIGIAGYAWMTDVEETSMLETPVASIYHHETIDVVLPDETSPQTQAPIEQPGAATPVAPQTQTPRPLPAPARVNPKTGPAPAMSVEDAQRFASILTGTETSNHGMGPMGDRTPGADLEHQIDDVGSRTVSVGNTADRFRNQHDGHIGTDHGPNIQNPTEVASNEPKNETDPKGRIKVKPLPGQRPDTTLTVEAVLDKINIVYMAGLQRCYRKGLVEDSTLQGKIAMAFTVTERGTLDEQSAGGVSSKVDECVTDLMASWRFPIPKDKKGDPSEQSFKLSLQLTPN